MSGIVLAVITDRSTKKFLAALQDYDTEWPVSVLVLPAEVTGHLAQWARREGIEVSHHRLDLSSWNSPITPRLNRPTAIRPDRWLVVPPHNKPETQVLISDAKDSGVPGLVWR